MAIAEPAPRCHLAGVFCFLMQPTPAFHHPDVYTDSSVPVYMYDQELKTDL